MPIYEKGYRRWDGELHGRLHRWWAIARTGVRLTGGSKWLKRFTIIAWLPLLYYGLIFFVVGQLTDVGNMEEATKMWQFGVFKSFFGGPLTERFIQDPTSMRPLIWSTLIHFFMHYTQIFCVMVVVAVVGPKLVSEDINSRALSLYFSRPLTRTDYIAGKLAVVGFWIASVSLVPAIALYCVSILFSPSLDTLLQTFVLVPKIVLYSVILVFACGVPMLALSSLIPHPRFLGFAWAVFWVMSYVVYRVLSLVLFPPFGPGAGSHEEDWTAVLSFSSNLDAIGFGIFDIGALMKPVAEYSPNARLLLDQLAYGHHWGWSLLIVLVLSAVSLAVIYRRIRAPEEQ
jgi:ABC-type transport system involved in multi-copper enzyme maturation permease subunit